MTLKPLRVHIVLARLSKVMKEGVSRKGAKGAKTQRKHLQTGFGLFSLCVFAPFASLREPSNRQKFSSNVSIFLQAVSNLLVLQAKSYPD